MKRIILLMIMVGSALLFYNCKKDGKNTKPRDTVTSGTINISVDESLRPLLETEIDTFMGTYKDATIHATYTSEDSAIQNVINDSSRLAIITRKLTPAEDAAFKNAKLISFQTPFAKEAIAVIVNRDNPDSIFSVIDLKDIAEGRISTWKQFNDRSKLDKIEVVLDNPRSGIVRYWRDSVARSTNPLPAYFYGVKSNEAVIDYVSKKQNAIGLIGVNWISDGDDPSSKKFLKSIRVARISKDSTAVQPYQGYIADHEYPLRRIIYIISRESRAALGAGFTAFITGNKGQLIVLKSGMVPATTPVRVVEFNRNKIE